MERRIEVEGICWEERLALGGVGYAKLSGLLEKGRGDIEVEVGGDAEVSGKRGK